MSARNRILQRLRAAPVLPIAPPEHPVAATAADARLLLDQFRHLIETFHGEVIDCRGSRWQSVLAEVCAAKQIASLLLPPSDLASLGAWPEGPELRRFDRPIEDFKAQLFNATDAGLTVADGAIADTGTLIQADSRRTPRTLSLVPPIHICLLDVRRLYPSLRAALAAEQWQAAMPSNLLFITGPSKTADIQQTLAYGAHGPRELVVLLTEGL